MDMLSRLKEIIAFYGLSVRAFAIKCGIAQKTLDNQLKGIRTISLETVISILKTFPDVSAEWLTRGEGTMLIKKDKDSAETERLNKLVDTIGTLQDTINAKNDMIATLNERIKQLESSQSK